MKDQIAVLEKGRAPGERESNSTTLVCPPHAANVRAVWPLIFGMLGLTSARSSRSFTDPSCPFIAAHTSGV